MHWKNTTTVAVTIPTATTVATATARLPPILTDLRSLPTLHADLCVPYADRYILCCFPCPLFTCAFIVYALIIYALAIYILVATTTKYESL